LYNNPSVFDALAGEMMKFSGGGRRNASWAWILVLLICLPGSAQDKGKEPRWQGNLSLGLSIAKGNTNSTSFSFIFAAGGPINQSKSAVWENKGVFLFSRTEGKTSAESLLVGSRIDWKYSGRYFAYAELQGLRDRFKNFSYRILPSFGFGYKILNGNSASLRLDIGLSQVFTQYYDTKDTESFTGLKSGQQFGWKISKSAEIREILEINFDVRRMSDFFLRLQADLITAITESWSVKLTFIEGYDNMPVGTRIKKNDITFIAGISRKF
jgi:putative salt-induced outer membrane protein YdiY